MRSVLRPVRAGDWWDDKLAPILATGYATACLTGTPLTHVAGALALVAAALIPGASYVGLLNDLTDRDSDRAAGRPDPLGGRSPSTWWALLVASVAVGAAVAVAAWGTEPGALVLYTLSWIAFGLYSASPARLKGRGFAGVLADSLGANLCPHLLMATVVLAACDRAADPLWLAAVGTWALAAGLRAALAHQLAHVDHDSRAGVSTFACRSPRSARWLGARVFFPVEVVSFVALLALAGAVAALVLMPAYALLEWGRMRRWRFDVVVVGPPREDAPFRYLLHDFYAALYPLGTLITATFQHGAAALVLLAHLLLFHGTLTGIAVNGYRLFRDSRLFVARG